MSLETAHILVGTPDQRTTGAISSAPVGTTLPTDTTTALDNAFVASGYVTEDGLTLAPDYSTSDLKDWSGTTVRKILESFDGTISFSLMQFDYESCCQAFGAEHVTRVTATAQHGAGFKVEIGNHIPKPRSWVFSMKDGDNRVRVVVPKGQVTDLEDIDFTSSDAIALGVTISCYDDGTGNSIYIYTDDGKVSA